MTMKLEIKVGVVELSFEGAVETFENKVEAVLLDLLELARSKWGAVAHSSDLSLIDPLPAKPAGPLSSMTAKSIATKLGVDSCSELAVAAFVSLVVFGRKDTVTRQQLTDEMKSATGFYKASYRGGNLTRSLDGLIKKDTIVEVATDTYSLKESARVELEGKLA